MGQSPSLQVHISPASLEIFRIFPNPKVQHRVYKCRHFVPVLSQINPFLTPILFIEDELYYSPIYA
jgi:hypothetical protein